MENFNRHAPCLDKKCSFCCDPVKMNQKVMRSGFDLPKDNDGNPLWKATGEVLIPEERADTDRVITYECINFNKDTGKCMD